jgi:hypothetical protein
VNNNCIGCGKPAKDGGCNNHGAPTPARQGGCEHVCDRCADQYRRFGIANPREKQLLRMFVAAMIERSAA